jgi:hypothetical protein
MPYKDINKHKTKINLYKKTYHRIRSDQFYSSIAHKHLQNSTKELIKFLTSPPYWSRGSNRMKVIKKLPEEKRNQILPILKKFIYKKIRDNTIARIKINKDFIQNILENTPCPCGETNPNKLEFHHTNPSKKTHESTQLLCRTTLAKMKEELEHCIVKCRNCHTILHNGSSSVQIDRLIRAYLNSNTKHRYSHKNGLLLFLYKSHQRCQKCNNCTTACLMFHHINHSTKEHKICRLSGYGIPAINRELSKTICLCQNCHNDFHAIYGNKTNKRQIEEYLGMPIYDNSVDLQNYQEEFKNLTDSHTPTHP